MPAEAASTVADSCRKFGNATMTSSTFDGCAASTIICAERLRSIAVGVQHGDQACTGRLSDCARVSMPGAPGAEDRHSNCHAVRVCQ